jgi:hypothetical protein
MASIAPNAKLTLNNCPANPIELDSDAAVTLAPAAPTEMAVEAADVDAGHEGGTVIVVPQKSV